MFHTCFNVAMAGSPYCLGLRFKNSDDYCDTGVGESVPKIKKQARNFQARWKYSFP